MFLYTWLWGSETTDPHTFPKQTEEIIDEFFLIDSIFEKVTKQDVKELYQKLPQLDDHQLAIRASICCESDAKKLITLFNKSIILPANKEEKMLAEGGPYKLAISSEKKKDHSSVRKTYHFFDGTILGARGRMAEEETITFPNGAMRTCSSQALIDLNRWGSNANLIVNHQEIALGAPQGDLKASLTEKLEIPLSLVSLLEKIDSALGSETRFTQFTKFFNQGPFNDMFYGITLDVQKNWNAVLFPNKEMKRSIHLIPKKGEKGEGAIDKIAIVLSGSFVAGAFGDAGVLEPREGQKLGVFTGITKVNLITGAATVVTHVQVYPEVWERALKLPTTC